MRDTDKVTLSLRQIKELVKEAKQKKVVKEAHSSEMGIDELVDFVMSYISRTSLFQMACKQIDRGNIDPHTFSDPEFATKLASKIDMAVLKEWDENY